MAIKTQGSGLYFVDSITVPATRAIIKLVCPTGIPGVGAGARSNIPTTCLDETEEETYLLGLAVPAQMAIPFNFDPRQVSHQILFDLKALGENLEWTVGFSDGIAAPTLGTDDVMVPPTDRTSARFTAAVADVAIDIATNTIVTGTLTLQRSGKTTWTWKS
ncbi:major tail subunit [Advenella kashmirensis W13003]|uniref:Major tail subunit n=1 Tax=Advenella kashmirensis W13003 TaxID=1424334 RepID=V8QL42_9BURK|nr:phage tail tube protein [Advenella kashmirensis]ETF00681.1 major tail subunit [Advenella kashmirensis W13003]